MIEITPRIENLLKNLPESARAEILKRAWNACCDGSILTSMDFDPWDGRHEEKRLEIEESCVSDVIKLGDFGDYIDSETSVDVLKHLAASDDMLVRASVAENSNCTSEILDLLFDRLQGTEDGCTDESADSIASNENTSVETLRQLAGSYFTADTHAALCANKNTPVDILEDFVRHDYLKIRKSLARNPNITPQMADILSIDDDDDVRLVLASNSATSRCVLERLSKDRCSFVQASVAANPNCPELVKKKLYNDAKRILDALADFNPDAGYTIKWG